MRINLSADSQGAVMRLQNCFKEVNSNVETEVTPFLNGLLPALVNVLTEKQIERMAPALTSTQFTQKRKHALLKRLSGRIDNALLEELEKQFPENSVDPQKTAENEAKHAEKA